MLALLRLVSVSSSLVLLLTGCGDSSLPTQSSARTSDNNQNNSNIATPAPPPAPGSPSGTGDGKAAIAPAPGSPSPVINPGAATVGCGSGGAAANAQLTEALTGLEIVETGSQSVLGIPINYTVDVMPSLNLQASDGEAVYTTSFNVSATPSAAQSTAQSEANDLAGATTTQLIPFASRASSTSAVPTWNGILCTLIPATQVTNALGGGNNVATYNPPLPAIISALADASFYTKELAQTLSFTNITASVSAATDPALKSGSTYAGTVSVQSVSPTLTTADGTGKAVTITADVAYSVTTNFGSTAVTNALGLRPLTTYYIDTTRHAYKAIVVQTGSTTVPQVVFTSN